MTPKEEADLACLFTYHPPTYTQKMSYERINKAALDLAQVIMAEAPACADRSAAIRKVREARMTANAAIACAGPADN